MGTLYIDRKDIELKMDARAIAFYSGNSREGIVPLEPLTRVIIVGNIRLQASVLHKLAANNISVIFLSGKRLKFSGRLNGKIHRNGLLRLKQYDKSQSLFALQFSADLVQTKLKKQVEFLTEILSRRKDLKLEISKAIETISTILPRLNELPNLDSLRGLEGSAAHAYFKAYSRLFAPSLGFQGRVRRPPPDPVNALLSLTYTLLHFEMVREIELIGLDPVIGFYHSFEYGRESLACDLVELFRPEVERLIYEAFRDEKFNSSDFTRDQSRTGCYLKKTSRKRYFLFYEEWAQRLRPQWQESVRDLARRIADGQDSLLDSK